MIDARWVCAIWYKILKLQNSAMLECHICEQLLENFLSVGSLALRHFRSMTEGKCKKEEEEEVATKKQQWGKSIQKRARRRN